MNFLTKLSPEMFLRLGLGLTYVYSGYNLFLNPDRWVWAVPSWFSAAVSQVVTIETYLRLQGLVELIIAFIFLELYANKVFVRIAAAVAAVEFTLILIFAPQIFITFRDVGLLGAALALFIMTLPRSSAAQPAN